MRTHTKESVTKEMFDKRNEFKGRITGLDGAKAKKLVTAIKNGAQGLESFKEAKKILGNLYPAKLRANDTDGKTAIVVLRRTVIHTIIGTEEAIKWETLIKTI